MAYTNPAELFLSQYGTVECSEDLMRYANFLRREAALVGTPPTDLSQIYSRFQIPTPQRIPLTSDLQGMLVDPELGIILINQDDPGTRQRFSEAHELMEVLFDLLPRRNGWQTDAAGNFNHDTKERLCNEGAAELLMPRESFLAHINQLGVSFSTARELAHAYHVSTTAALVHMTRIAPGRHAVVLFRMKNKPSELKAAVPDNQIPLFEDIPSALPSKKLRVEWVFSNSSVPFIPPDKSVPEDSSIYEAWATGIFTAAEIYIDLSSICGKCFCESHPFDAWGERQVLALLHLPGDSSCKGWISSST